MEEEVKARFDDVEKRLLSVDKRFDDVKWYFGGTSAFLGIVFTVLAIFTGKQNDAITKQNDSVNAAIQKQAGDLNTFERETEEDNQRSFALISGDLQHQQTLAQDGMKDYRSSVEGRLSEKSTDLQKSEEEMRAELRLREEPPVLELLGVDGKTLNGQSLVFENNPLLDDRGNEVPNGHVISFEVQIRNTGKSMSGPLYLKAYSDDIQFPYQVTDGSGFKYSTVIDQSRIPNQIPGGGFTKPEFWNLTVVNPVGKGKHPLMLKLYYDGSRVAEAQAFLELAH